MTAKRRPRNDPAANPADPAEAAAFLRRLVAAVADGTLEASSPQARRLVSRMELVADAFEALAATNRTPDEASTSDAP